MYLPILALLYLLIPSTYANGCHTGHDQIGCPTVLSDDVFTSAIADFCTNHLTLPYQPPLTLDIDVGTSWPGPVYSLPEYEDQFDNMVEFWANFRVDRTSNGDPYTLTYPLCISLLEQAYIGNGSSSSYGTDCQYTGGSSFGGWGNTDFGTVFAEAICPPGISCLPLNLRPLGC